MNENNLIDKKMVKRCLVKCVIVGVLFGLYKGLQDIFRPIITNQVAVNQLNSSTDSFTLWAAYQKFWAAGGTILILMTILLFWREGKIVFQYIKNQNEK
jgi:hypothetical protein